MASLIFLDTHAVVLLSQNQSNKLSVRGRRLIETSEVRISSFVALELQFLFEIGRIKHSPSVFLPDLMHRLDAGYDDEPLAKIVEKAERLSWTHDAFDRLIVAHAASAGAPLLTRDARIQEHYPKAVW